MTLHESINANGAILFKKILDRKNRISTEKIKREVALRKNSQDRKIKVREEKNTFIYCFFIICFVQLNLYKRVNIHSIN